MELKGKAALVTGASRGLGAALVRALAREGARVVAVARGRNELEAVVDGVKREGREVHALAFDVGDKEAIHKLTGAAAALVGPIDLLVHNASTLGPTPLPLLLDTECEDLERVLQVNLIGPFRLSKVVAGSMALRGSGLILQLSSDAATNAYPRWGAYGVSKAALDHLGRVWSAELEGTGVRVLNIDPGEMNTQMHRDAMPDADPATLADPAKIAERLIAIVKSSERIANGSRLEAASWTAPGAEAR